MTDTKQPHALKGVKLAPKYRDPATGLTWAGRGRTPSWVLIHESRGGSREELRIKEGERP